MTNAAKKYASRKVIPFRKERGYRYPNAADRQYRQNQVLNLALTCATCLGTAVTLAFLMLL